MKSVLAAGTRHSSVNRQLIHVALLLSSFTCATRGAPPVDPLPPPLYSFGAGSPTVMGGFVDADGVLMLGFPHPGMMHHGGMLGMGQMGDDLDAMSTANAQLAPATLFALLFSVDEASVGVADPDPDLVTIGVPHNALDQALRGQAAGDQFMTTQLFTRTDPLTGASPLTQNNVLLRNNFDEGGNDFSALPPTSAADTVVDEPQDRLDATVAVSELAAIYYSASAGSPSLDNLPGSEAPSGAHVYHHSFGPGGGPPTLFASFSDFGLVQADDIDALIVFDTNSDGMFNVLDQVLFSLTRESPSLATIPGASTTGAAADVFLATPGASPSVFAPASMLGLGDPLDDLDALEYVACDDAEACAAAHGIRTGSGIPAVSTWGMVAMMLSLLVAGSIVLSRQRPKRLTHG